MPGSEPRDPDPLTRAGHVKVEPASLRRHRVLALDLPSITNPLPRSRIRQARELAAVGTRLVRDGKYALALERFGRSVALDPSVAAVQLELGLVCLTMGRLEEAAVAFRCAISLDPDLALAHLKLATIFEALGEQDAAQAAYSTGLRLAPSEHWAYARLAHIHRVNGHPAEAEAALRAAAAASSPPRSRLYEVNAELMAGWRNEAEDLVRAVIATDPSFGEAHVILGQIQSEDGRASEAVASFERGISLDPDMVGWWSNLVSNRKFRKGDDVMFGQMKACLQRSDLTPHQQQSVHFALGKAYDDVGDYAAAMVHVDAANRVRGAQDRFERTRLADHISHIIASAPAGFLERRPDLGVDDATPIAIVGMPRSGTTLVEQGLSSHPKVAAGGELTYWGQLSVAGLCTFDLTVEAEAVRRVVDGYLALLRAVSPDAARVTDKAPFNFFML